jgi:hypothetical protein
VEDAPTYPQPLVDLEGPLPRDRVERVLCGMGPQGVASRALVEGGLAPPEVLTGLTLALLAGQPRRGERGGAARPSGVAGGVWVREQLTVHAPVPLDTPLVISGALLRRFVRKGRHYAVSASRTHDASGRLLASNLTTGLERYRPDPGEPDVEEGVPETALPVPRPDASAAAANPCVETLRSLRAGDRLQGDPVEISLERLRDRDGPVPLNPIHSDPEAARRAGLDVPIAGGAHVLAFLEEVLLQAWGERALYHGAHVDVRWTAPVRAGTWIVPRAEVTFADPRRVELALEVRCDDARAMAGHAIVPLCGEDGPA